MPQTTAGHLYEPVISQDAQIVADKIDAELKHICKGRDILRRNGEAAKDL